MDPVEEAVGAPVGEDLEEPVEELKEEEPQYGEVPNASSSKKPVDLEEIQMERLDMSNESPAQNPENMMELPPASNPQQNHNQYLENKERLERAQRHANLEVINEFHNTSFIELTVLNYQRSTLWIFLVCTFCALRGANGFTVTLAYLSLLCRVVQAVSIVVQNEKLCQGAYSLATLFTLILFFACFAKESADIVHEVRPTEEQMTYEMLDINYKP
mmetsp:Transcript_7057/g.11881  ORF Transcript_7057/g.11881 Transcript_7057/m.11881 type:complete len:216 (-) Transcript_7057:22-669(-)